MNNLARIDIKDLTEEEIEAIDRQAEKYGFTSRVAYVKFLIKLDVLSDVVEIIKERRNSHEE